jgi:hypothetical protein
MPGMPSPSDVEAPLRGFPRSVHPHPCAHAGLPQPRRGASMSARGNTPGVRWHLQPVPESPHRPTRPTGRTGPQPRPLPPPLSLPPTEDRPLPHRLHAAISEGSEVKGHSVPPLVRPPAPRFRGPTHAARTPASSDWSTGNRTTGRGISSGPRSTHGRSRVRTALCPHDGPVTPSAGVSAGANAAPVARSRRRYRCPLVVSLREGLKGRGLCPEGRAARGGPLASCAGCEQTNGSSLPQPGTSRCLDPTRGRPDRTSDVTLYTSGAGGRSLLHLPRSAMPR